MKQAYLSMLLIVLMSMVGAKTFAYDIAVENADGVTIYYNFINDGTELEVNRKEGTPINYSGIVNIPEAVTYEGKTYKVTFIGYRALSSIRLTEVTIPNSVTSIGDRAFDRCTSLLKLVCMGSQLTSLDVSGCTVLKVLDCYDNQLTSLDVSKNTALAELNCSGNQLTSLDVSHNPALYYLHCYSNQIKGVEMDAIVNNLSPNQTERMYCLYVYDSGNPE